MASSEEAVIGCHSVEEWKEHFQKGVECKKLVVVDFTASWCGPCRFIAPIFAELAKKFSDVIFLKVDVDELDHFCRFLRIIKIKLLSSLYKTVAEEFKVEAMPTFLFLKEGKEVDRIVGANKKGLEDKVTEHGALTA